MESQPVVVDRRRLKKSHNGCERCKTRRIKCDEGKPSCVQCTSKQKICPGYAQTLKWSSKHQRRANAAHDEQNQTKAEGKTGRRSRSQAKAESARKPGAPSAGLSNLPSQRPEEAGCDPSSPTATPLHDSLGHQDWVPQRTLDFAPQDSATKQAVQNDSQVPPVQVIFDYEGLGWDTFDHQADLVLPPATDNENTMHISLLPPEIDGTQSQQNFHIARNTPRALPTEHSQIEDEIPPDGEAERSPGIAAESSSSPFPLLQDTAYAPQMSPNWLSSLFDCGILASNTVPLDRPNVLQREMPEETESSTNHDQLMVENRLQITQYEPERHRETSSVRSSSGNLMLTNDGNVADGSVYASIEPNYEIAWPPRSAQLRNQPVHTPTFLIQYWFSRVCPIFSTFDCGSNPLRVQLDLLWQQSGPVYHSMLSMAAVCLHDQLPQMKRVAVQSKSEATAQLQSHLKLLESSNDTDLHEDLLMTCYLLGFSTAWHNAQDLGFKYLDAAKALLKRTSGNNGSLSAQKGQIKAFFVDGLVYWRMIAGAVGYVDNSQEPKSSSSITIRDTSCSPTPSCSPDLSKESLPFPHPWTGSATTAQDIIFRVFTLGRRQRARLIKGDFSKRKDLEQALQDIQAAQKLEEALLELDGRSLGAVQDTGDSRTPRSHFVHLLEAYRVAGLLLIYRSFPDLSMRRLGLLDCEESQAQVESFLRSLAIFVIDQLRHIHPTSGTRCIQPILLISVSSELKFQSISSDVATELSADGYISQDDVATAKARGFILDRLHCYERSLPSRPITTAKSLVREVWDRLDSGQHCHWTEVVMDTKLQSFFG